MSDSKVYAEVLGVLMALGNKFIDKVPKEIMQYLTQNCDVNSIPAIDKNKRIEDQNVSSDAKAFLTMLKLKYWCKTEKEKNELLNLLSENEKKHQEELKKKYNTDNIFKKKIKKDTANINEISVIEHEKSNFITILLKKIKNLFSKMR